MNRTRRNHSAAVRAKVALAALQGDKTLAESSEQFQVHVSQMTPWKTPLRERANEFFATAAERCETAGPEVKELHANIYLYGRTPSHIGVGCYNPTVTVFTSR